MRLARLISFVHIALITIVGLAATLIIGLVAITAHFNAKSISGIYVQKFSNGLEFIQIVATKDGKVAGRGESVILEVDGKLTDNSFALDGSTDGYQISLKSNLIFGFGFTYSGTADGTSLRLISDDGPLHLFKSDLDTFATEKISLQARGQSIASARQE
jgi:hypothetical protein